MLVNEAFMLATILDDLAPTSILDLGSGSRADREISQPHIGAAFRGHNVYWTDLVAHPGVRRCDITDKSTLVNLPRCELVTALSILEHVTDIDAAMENLRTLVVKWLLVSMPCSYPHHECPIDNDWRPTPGELADRLERTGLSIQGSWLSQPETFWGVEGATSSVVLASVNSSTRQ